MRFAEDDERYARLSPEGEVALERDRLPPEPDRRRAVAWIRTAAGWRSISPVARPLRRSAA